MTVFDFSAFDALRAWALENPDFIKAYTNRPAEIHRLAESVLKTLDRDPIIGRYLQAHRAMMPAPRNTEPWMAHAERLLGVTLVLAAVLGYPKFSIHSTIRDEARYVGVPVEMFAVGVAMRMLMGTPYLWSNAIDDLVRASPLPKHTISRAVLPLPLTFWSFETGYPVLNATELFGEPTGEVLLDWMHLEHQPGGVLLFTVVCDPRTERRVFARFGAIPYGLTYPDQIPKPALASTQLQLQRLAFVVSPYVTTEPMRLPREIRREQARAGIKPEQEPVVHVVRLRRARPVATQDDVGDSRMSQEWHHHWWVSGHYRAQWHPSTQDHRVTWIAPYVKGPLDKPLLPGKVFVVDR